MKRNLTTLFVFASALFCSIGTAAVQPSAGLVESSKISEETATLYTRPHDLVDIGGGRKINLFCMGSGKQTVLFEAGGSDWSVIWALVQPEVAKGARACAYDRAGLGYSDPARMPRSPMAIAEDVHALIRAAKLETPVVLVGHSLGGFNMKLYAALYPDDVAGLVLIDPSEERLFDRTRDFVRRKFGISAAVRAELRDQTWLRMALTKYERCVAEARDKDIDPASNIYRACADPSKPALGETIAAARQTLQVKRAFQEAQQSELSNSVFADARGDNAYEALFEPGVFGDKPMIVLLHGNYDANDELESVGQATLAELHGQTAALSRRGRLEVVPNSGHYIHLDAPNAVVGAVNKVVQEASVSRR